MSDPLSEVISLLQPRAVFSKIISGAGRWGVRYAATGSPSFSVVLEGSCRLAVDGHDPITLQGGDFVLLPATPGFTMSGFEPGPVKRIAAHETSMVLGEVRHGTRGGRPDVRMLGGWFLFDSPDTALLVSLLPSLVHVRGIKCLSTLVRLVANEASDRRSGRDLVLTRLAVRVHFVREEHGQRCRDALTELDTIHHDHQATIAHDVDEGTRRERRWRGLTAWLRQRGGISVERHQQTAGGGQRDTNEAAPARRRADVRVEHPVHGHRGLSQLCRSTLDGVADAHVGAAPTEIAAHRVFDVRIGGRRVVLQ